MSGFMDFCYWHLPIHSLCIKGEKYVNYAQDSLVNYYDSNDSDVRD